MLFRSEFLDTDLDFFELGEEEPQNEKEKPRTDKKKSSAAKRKAPSLSVKKTASAPAKSKKGTVKNGASRSSTADTERQKDKSFGSSAEVEEKLAEPEKYKQYTAFDDSSAPHSDRDNRPEKDGGAETQQQKGGEDK